MIDLKNYPGCYAREYFNQDEEISDYLQLLNMALDAAIEVMQAGNDDRLFSEDSSMITLVCNQVKKNSLNSIVNFDDSDYLCRITVISERFGLGFFGFVCLLLGAAPSFDGRVIEKYRMLRDDHDEHNYPTFALAKKVYSYLTGSRTCFDVRDEHNTIEGCPVFRVKNYGKSNVRDHDSFSVSRQLISILKGEMAIPEKLKPFCFEVDDEPGLISGASVAQSVRYLFFTNADIDVLNVYGPKGAGKKFLLQKGVEDEKLLYVNTSRLLSLGSDGLREGILDVLVRAGILRTDIVLSDVQVTQTNSEALRSLISEIVRLHGRVIVTSLQDEQVRDISEGYSYHAIKVEKPKASERLRLWKQMAKKFGEIDEDVLKEASLLYDITPGMIENGVRSAKAYATEDGRDDIEIGDIKRAILSFNSSKLSSLATPLNGKYMFDDLRIADGQKRLLKLACSRIRNKGLVEDEWGLNRDQTYGHGVSILLYGPPGTGKTMAATVIANEVGRALYRVDLSQMIDKYVGETEKNLGKVFDAARDGNFVLFFDEADSLFAKRTEVTNSNDKHANNEVSYLLQKMEEYDGLSIMATNRFNNFDNAFLRRITYIVNLDKPDAETRLVMYKNILSGKIPVDPKLDVEFFAREFEISGSLIRGMITNAAYMAASENVPINNKHFVNAMFLEEKKDGRKLGFEDFKQYGVLLDIRM